MRVWFNKGGNHYLIYSPPANANGRKVKVKVGKVKAGSRLLPFNF